MTSLMKVKSYDPMSIMQREADSPIDKYCGRKKKGKTCQVGANQIRSYRICLKL